MLRICRENLHSQGFKFGGDTGYFKNKICRKKLVINIFFYFFYFFCLLSPVHMSIVLVSLTLTSGKLLFTLKPLHSLLASIKVMSSDPNNFVLVLPLVIRMLMISRFLKRITLAGLCAELVSERTLILI